MNKYEKEVQKTLLNNEKEVLEELEKTYVKSLSTIKARISELMGKSDELTQSQIYQLRFQQNLEQQVSAIVELLKQDVKTKTNTYLTSVYENSFIGESYNLSKTYKMNTFVGINQNAVVKTVEKPIEKMTFADRTNVNMNDFKKAIKNEISRGFATSMSYSQMARNVSLVAEKNMYKAYRIARTEGLRVQSESKLDYNNSLKEKYGADLVKRWDSTLDGVTRPEHQELDGQIRELEEDFECSGGKAQAPGLFGDPAMDCNCRCCVTTLPRWAIDVPLTKLDNANPFKEDGNINLIDGKDYEEYKKNYYEYLNNKENDDTIKEHVVIDGKNIVGEFERRKEEFDFEIEDIVNKQGFDGKPKVVDVDEFKKCMKESNFYAERTYSANSKEILNLYKEELYNGKWYIDCSTGGAQYGQGMYCASCYDLSNNKQMGGIGWEMLHYQELNKSKGNPFAYTEAITLDKTAKILELPHGEDTTYISNIYVKEYMKKYATDIQKPFVKTFIELDDKINELAIGLDYENDKEYEKFQKLLEERDKVYKSGDLKELRTKGFSKSYKRDAGSLATEMGYDAIKADGHGTSGSYTVILNRTKVIFCEKGSLYGN